MNPGRQIGFPGTERIAIDRAAAPRVNLAVVTGPGAGPALPGSGGFYDINRRNTKQPGLHGLATAGRAGTGSV